MFWNELPIFWNKISLFRREFWVQKLRSFDVFQHHFDVLVKIRGVVASLWLGESCVESVYVHKSGPDRNWPLTAESEDSERDYLSKEDNPNIKEKLTWNCCLKKQNAIKYIFSFSSVWKKVLRKSTKYLPNYYLLNSNKQKIIFKPSTHWILMKILTFLYLKTELWKYKKNTFKKFSQRYFSHDENAIGSQNSSVPLFISTRFFQISPFLVSIESFWCHL